MRLCAICKIDISARHANAVMCVSCASIKKARPVHNLTLTQQREALKLAGTVYREEIAKLIGCSKSSFTRFARENNHINWNAHKYSDETIKKVCEFYLTHTLAETQKKFPGVTVRCIIDRYISEIKCRKWTDEEVLKLYKFTGLACWPVIATHLQRKPNAPHRKRARTISGKVNSLTFYTAKNYVHSSCPFFYIRLRGGSVGQWVAPWVVLEKHLKESNPPWVNEAFRALAKFQRWLHGSDERVFEIIEGKL